MTNEKTALIDIFETISKIDSNLEIHQITEIYIKLIKRIQPIFLFSDEMRNILFMAKFIVDANGDLEDWLDIQTYNTFAAAQMEALFRAFQLFEKINEIKFINDANLFFEDEEFEETLISIIKD